MGSQRLSADIMDLYSRADRALEAVVRKGGPGAEEDDSRGYALVKEPAARALQIGIRKWALGHERELLEVVQSSSDVQHRRVASDALGYARQSKVQIVALVRAARDPDTEVLIEMSLWRDPSHAFYSRLILGRVAGIPEDRLNKLAWNGPPEEIVKAALRN